MTKLFLRSILSTAYLPPLDYFKVICNSEEVLIEGKENYQKQSYRNRCHICGANGILPLIVPVSRNVIRLPVTEVQIDNTKPWQKQHIGAIVSAYRSAPFFEHYMDQIIPVLGGSHTTLFDLNLSLLYMLIELFDIECSISVTENYSKSYTGYDFRELIHPKRERIKIAFDGDEKENRQYHQVFAHKHGFIPNLSVLDLLFNEGPQAVLWLKT